MAPRFEGDGWRHSLIEEEEEKTMECLQQIPQALLTVVDRVYHYKADDETAPYLVWAETGGGMQLQADNIVLGQVFRAMVDYYTAQENDPNLAAIPAALNAAGISVLLNSVKHESEAGLTHYIWQVEVVA